MSVIEEHENAGESIQEETGEGIQEEAEDISSSADLEEKKHTTNEQKFEGNTGHIQICIQNLSALNIGYKQSSEQTRPEQQEKTYDLRELKDCTQFIEKYGNSDYLVMAIILCTFDMVNLRDLPQLQEKLKEQLLFTNSFGSGGEEDLQKSVYLSLDTILAVIGGKYFIREDGQKCVGFGENSKKILIHILEQFPVLKKTIVSWLFQVNQTYRYYTAFDANQIATAFARIVSIDLIYAKSCILPQLYSNSSNTGLLGVLALKLYEDTALKGEIRKLILAWLAPNSKWLWKSACMVCCGLNDEDDDRVFETALKKAIGRRLLSFSRRDIYFSAELLRQSKYFRTVFTNVLSYVFDRQGSREKRVEVAKKYIRLIQYGYYLVTPSFAVLPLVVCDTRQQQKELENIIAQTMAVYDLRKKLYVILETYLKEVSAYNLPENTINYICAYFCNMASPDGTYWQDILAFLQKNKNKAAREIYRKLYLYHT